LFGLFCFYTKKASYDVSFEPEQKEDQPKQSDREHILAFFRKFSVVLVCFEIVLFFFSCFDLGSENTETNGNKQKIFVFDFAKQTKTQPKQILFQFVSVRTKFFFPFRGHTTSESSLDRG
jgi:hypothetical protein